MRFFTAFAREFIAFLKQHHTVLDPTMNIFEGLFSGDPSAVTPGLEETAFFAQIRRAMRSGALEVPKEKADAYREAFPAMLRLPKAVHEAGVTILPGHGRARRLHASSRARALRAGRHSGARGLRMATLTPALVMGVNKDRGAIANGKLADLILVDGDPRRQMSDLGKITMVMKGGRIYDPKAIEAALGIAAR